MQDAAKTNLKFGIKSKSEFEEVRIMEEKGTSERSATADRSVRVPESLALTEDKNPRFAE